MASVKVAELVKKTEIIDSKQSNDTLRLWENYREQATLWRSLALLQIPVTGIAIIFALVFWFTRSITLNVPAKPLPGIYTAQEIPDSEFINVATDLLNLVATYQPAVARRQFAEARTMLVEPMLAGFDVEMMGTELKAIENTSRTQVFFPDPTKTSLIRYGRDVSVQFIGDRLKIIAGKELPVIETSYQLIMTTIPKNKLNPYGIVVKNLIVENVK